MAGALPAAIRLSRVILHTANARRALEEATQICKLIRSETLGDRMSNGHDDKDLPKHILDVRKYLTPEKADAFEASYRRMRQRSRRWDVDSTRPPVAPGSVPAVDA